MAGLAAGPGFGGFPAFCAACPIQLTAPKSVTKTTAKILVLKRDSLFMFVFLLILSTFACQRTKPLGLTKRLRSLKVTFLVVLFLQRFLA
jgi:hypothetical protein